MGRLATIFCVAVFCFGHAQLAIAAEDDLVFDRKALKFEHPVISAGEALRALSPDRDALIVRTRDSQANHKIHFFSADTLATDAPQITQTVDVPKNAIFYTLGEMPDGEMEKLLIFTEKGISAYDPTNNRFAPLVETSSLFRQGTDLRFQRSGFARDLNNDERFDLLVQDFDGLKVFLQRADGTFSGETLIPVEPELRLTGSLSNDNISDTALSLPAARTPTFRIFPSYIADVTGDGKSDISFLIGRELKIFAQTASGGFSTTPLTTGFLFEVRGNTWRDEILSAEKNTDQRNFKEVTIYRVLDMDGDDVLDVITVNNEASGLLDREQEFRVHFGRVEGGKVAYSQTADQILDFGGIGGAGFRDVNDDGRKDFVVTSTKLSIGRVISFLLNRKLSVQTKTFLDDGQGNFKEDKDYRGTRSIKIDLGRALTTNPPWGYADFNGDGAIDLMTTSSKGRMQLFLGGKGEPFEHMMAEIKDDFPHEGALVVTEDINGDAKADIIVPFSPIGFDGEEKKTEVVLHLSK